MQTLLFLALAINLIAGGLWRRWFGGWRVPSRPFLGTCLEAVFWVMKDGVLQPRRLPIQVLGLLLTWPLFVVLAWYWAIPLALGLVAFFSPGHTVDHPTKVWLRYGPFAIAYVLALRFYPRDRWTFGDGLVDGPFAVGELGLGGLFWGTVALVLIFA